jgi:uncharacterized protein
MRYRSFFFATILFSFVGILSVQAQSTATSKHRIVMQLSSSDTLVWKGLMNNLKHLKAGWGENVQIEVVAHGPGIEMLMKNKTTQQEKIASFTKAGIVFMACENTLKEKNISKENIIAESHFVPMGIGEIVSKQELGWSYIKVGF